MATGERVQAELILTARGTANRLAKKEAVAFERPSRLNESEIRLFVDSGKTFQTIEGFGGALTDSSAEVWAGLPEDKRAELLTAYFDPDKGLGYTFCRTNIHSCDFSSESYVYDDDPADTQLTKFDIGHDRRFRLPFIKAALSAARTPFKLLASPWTPPAFMKSNRDLLHGGKLLPEFAPVWARYYGKFVRAYESEGVRIWGLTVQNEPLAVQTWESCIFTGEEERDFVRDHLGPQLAADGLGSLPLLVWDHNRDVLYQRARVVYDDPDAGKFVWGAAFHWYVGDYFDQVRQVAEAWPDKRLLFTEGCIESFDPGRLDDWSHGERYARSMVADTSNGACGWIDWNVLLDDKGGPNHVGNFCFAPVHADTRTGNLSYLSSYYYIGHFSKFVRPGAKRVSCVTGDDRLQAVAFRNPDGRIAVVVLNLGDEAIAFDALVDGLTGRTTSPAHSILTLIV